MNVMCVFWRGMLVHLWQTTRVLAFILLLERAFRGAPSRASHALWSIGLAKIFLPLSLLGGLSDALYRAIAGGAASHGRAALLVLPSVNVVLDPISGRGLPAPGSVLSYTAVAATICWAALAAFFISRIFIDAVRARRHGGRSLSSVDSPSARRLEGILDAAGIPRGSVLLCETFVMPRVVGLARPRILIPEGLVLELEEGELRAILLHEETHRRRRDPLRTAIYRVGLALFFFYPPLYPVLRRLRSTDEFACDESVIQSGVSARTYARALAGTLERGLAAPAFAAAAAGERSSLGWRLKRLHTLDPRRYAMRLQYRILIAVAALAVAAATFYPVPMQAGPGRVQNSNVAQTQGTDTASVGQTSDAFDVAPQLIKTTLPKYPEKARTLGIQATVLLDVFVDAQGKVLKATVMEVSQLEGNGGSGVHKDRVRRFKNQFVEGAIEAVKQFEFTPAKKDDKPVAAQVAIPIRFKLN